MSECLRRRGISNCCSILCRLLILSVVVCEWKYSRNNIIVLLLYVRYYRVNFMLYSIDKILYQVI